MKILETINSVIKDFTFFANEKWTIASDKRGSGNTANIGSIKKIEDILSGNGVFKNLGEEFFDDYWMNYGKIIIRDKQGKKKKITSLEEFLEYKNMDINLANPKARKVKKIRIKMKIKIPPIKIQGIKTKLIPLLLENIADKKYYRWIEPFLGSGIVALNVLPKKAILCDKNPHIINFYNSIKNEIINNHIIKEYLKNQGEILLEKGQSHYYYIRDRFNEEHNPLDFLFLNRSCFNGMIRFNKKFKFNVPFCHKPNRFSKSYITKIVNQVKQIEYALSVCKWDFKCQDYKITINEANRDDFIYCDPPYIGRHVDYYDSWDENEELELYRLLIEKEALFLLSTWHSNKYRFNEYLSKIWKNCNLITYEHFYHIGAKEKNRNSILEAFVANFELKKDIKKQIHKEKQLYLF